MTLNCEVAIVGAGPAGSWTAALLARQGARVALIDSTHPREKPCGGGVTGRALALVREVPAMRRLPSVRIRTAQFLDPRANDVVSVDLAAGPDALVVASRRDFDNVLYAEAVSAGAHALAARVVNVSREGPRFVVGTADGSVVRASFLVGADGANSLVRRRMSCAFRRNQLSIATGFFAHGVTSDAIVLEMTGSPPGYIWSFPRPDHLAIGICAQADAGATAETLRAAVRRWIDRTQIAGRARLQPYSWPIPSLDARDFTSLELSGPGWLTVGDAAGLVDPITREGIFFALLSATFAADALASARRAPTAAFAQRVRQEIGEDLARAARYKTGFFRPRFTQLLLDALRSSRGIRAVMADLVAGTQSYRGLAWRLAATRELGLAWRLLCSLAASPSARNPLSH
jgi:geranylgeranyl reductase family protein